LNKGLPPLIELVNASVVRGDQVVLKSLTLRIEVGEHVAILGPNGCGKSTLVRTLTREFYPLYQEDSHVRLFGREKWNVFELWSLLGIVSNHFPLPSRTVTGRELVIGSFFSSVGLWPIHEVTREMEEKADAALAQMDATHLANRDFEELSSGEARRILIARALVHSPKALLLDEPSTSLDLTAQHELRESMRRLAQSGHRDSAGDASFGRHHSRDRSGGDDEGRRHRGGWASAGAAEQGADRAVVRRAGGLGGA
jgi:iron complex transport system ATP-binding protein